jgi:hypothetical protein
MINLVSMLDSQILTAYKQAKKARAEGDYAAMIRWMLCVDRLLDRRGVTSSSGLTAVAGQAGAGP